MELGWKGKAIKRAFTGPTTANRTGFQNRDFSSPPSKKPDLRVIPTGEAWGQSIPYSRPAKDLKTKMCAPHSSEATAQVGLKLHRPTPQKW